jgi:hypothetical protein
MTIFEQLRDIIADKQGILLDKAEPEKEFTPFLVQRWLSMYSSPFTQILNSSTNLLWNCVDDNYEWYKLFMVVIPKSRMKSISYIKKSKKEHRTDKNADLVKKLAERLELSRREIKEYIECGAIDLKQVKKYFK